MVANVMESETRSAHSVSTCALGRPREKRLRSARGAVPSTARGQQQRKAAGGRCELKCGGQGPDANMLSSVPSAEIAFPSD